MRCFCVWIGLAPPSITFEACSTQFQGRALCKLIMKSCFSLTTHQVAGIVTQDRPLTMSRRSTSLSSSSSSIDQHSHSVMLTRGSGPFAKPKMHFVEVSGDYMLASKDRQVIGCYFVFVWIMIFGNDFKN
jgi:hypothetical protein